MASATYDEILRGLRQLQPDEQRRLLSELAALVEHTIPSEHRRSILELRGLGKDLWRQTNSTAYLKAERDAWGRACAKSASIGTHQRDTVTP